MGDLFTTQDESFKPLIERLGGWGEFFTYAMMTRLKTRDDWVNKLRETEVVYPYNHDYLRIFKDLPLGEVKVVIVGQDPYHDLNANGYAFGCDQTVSPSLSQIVAAIKHDVKARQTDTANKSLDYLVAQGVMLFNTALTVGQEPMSHKNLQWDTFTGKVIQLIGNQKQPIVWMLWGGEAQKMKKHIHSHSHLILEAEHPAFASRQRRVWYCDHFTKANNHLKEHGLSPIKWI